MSIFKKWPVWLLVFAILFLFSQDFWNWDEPAGIGLFHIPTAVYFYIFLQVVLAGLLLLFSKTFWRKNEGGEHEHVR